MTRSQSSGSILLLTVCVVAVLCQAAPPARKPGGKPPPGGSGAADDAPAPAEGQSTEALKEIGGFPAEWFMGDAKARTHYNALTGKPMPALGDLEQFIPDTAGTYVIQNRVGVIILWTQIDDDAIETLGKLEPLYQKFKDKKFGMLAVCTSAPQDQYERVVKRQKITYASARDPQPEFKVYRTWKPSAWPTIVVVDAAGKVRAWGLKRSRVEDVVIALLKESGQLPADYAIGNRAIALAQPAVGGSSPSASSPSSSSSSSGSSPATKPSSRAASEKKPETEVASNVPAPGSPIPREWLEGTDEQRQRLAPIDQQWAQPLFVSNWYNVPNPVDEPPITNDFLGKVALLVFWDPASEASTVRIAALNALQEKYSELQVVGISPTRTNEKMHAVATAKKVKYIAGVDDGGQTEQAYLVDGYDDYYLLGRNGKLRIADCKEESLEVAIQYLLAEPVDKLTQSRMKKKRVTKVTGAAGK